MEKDFELIESMKEKVELLNRAAKAYYVDGTEIMSNLEYDKLYDELLAMEGETGTVLASSPTQKVGYEVLSELPKEEHGSPMLSLDKTKDREELVQWLGDQRGVLSWKLDGLTVVLTYQNGELRKAVTRGNGIVGEVITPNAKTFVNLPLKIAYNGDLVIRGEAVISYRDFEAINESMPEMEAKYKNPRNLCSGSVRQLDSSITKSRNVRFYAFALVSAGTGVGDGQGSLVEDAGIGVGSSRMAEFRWLSSLGFDVVEYAAVTASNIVEQIGEFEKRIPDNPIPSDGLVLSFDDIEYGRSLGETAKFPRDSIAFKWQDQIAETTLREIEWSASRTGLINPVAIFDPVELEGTTVTRASLHNISIMEELELAIGDTIEVYKANMIIPQVADNLTKSGPESPPSTCPVCGQPTRIQDENGVRTLFCDNLECTAKKIKSFSHFVSRNAMDVEGLSGMTIEKLIAKGIIHQFADIYNLDAHRDTIINMEGLGEKSYEKLVEAVDRSRHVSPDRLLYALGISGIGSANAKVIAKACGNSWSKIQELRQEELTEIEGVGPILAQGFVEYFSDPTNMEVVDNLLKVLDIEEGQAVDAGQEFLQGLTFVITGTLNHYSNRDQLVEVLEKAGAKVAGSVSSKTSYLINNDIQSNSGKNKKAKDLGVPIIDEETVITWMDKKQKPE